MFGRDPIKDPVGVLGRVGYLSEENDLPPWMRVHELLRYIRAFYPGWDNRFADELRERFAIDPAKRVRDLSRGQKAHHELIAPRTLAWFAAGWIAAAAGLLALALWLLPAETVSPPLVGAAAVLLGLSLVRLGLAPLALEWNRYR